MSIRDFCHRSTIIRGRGNTIDFPKTRPEQRTSDNGETGQVFADHFQAIFYTTSNPPIPSDLHTLSPTILSQEDNQSLWSISDSLEIQEAVFLLGSLKSPRSNGMPALFYRKHWNTVGLNIVDAVQSFFRGNYLLKQTQPHLYWLNS